MTIEIRPPAEDELRAAMEAAEVAFGSAGVEDEDWERERKALPASRALAAFDGGKPVALAGAYEFDLTIPGGELPVRRRDLGRRDADAPPPGDPARLHAAAARGRPRLGRADRGALGVRGGDLRPLRLRAGGAECAREVGLARGSRCAQEAGRLRSGSSTPTRRSRSSRRSTSASARTRAGMLSRDERWWKEHRLADPEELAARREPEVLRRRRGRRRGRGLRVLPGQGRVGGRLREGRGARDRGARDLGRGREELWRFLHGIDLDRAASRSSASIPARRCRCSFATRARSGCGSATGSGCGSSTSTPR